ncbi:MAG: hypothetical protein M0R80_22285 [Proteobacteria bacterium]|jgi:hypothetical protein|nr:hypothetical protein [Pseudomonadota bacterium]
MKKVFSLFVIMVLAAGLMSSCDASEKLCGPCGDITKGDTFISGDARIDGLFTAVGKLGTATADIDASFKADVMALGEVFGSEVTADMEIGDMVAQVKADIQAEFAANLDGGISVNVVPPKCEASVNVAVEAQATCEAKAGCEVSAECTGGELSVQCEGSCSGGCSGTCEGSCSAKIEGGGCSGECKGSCTLEAAATCEGTCKGTCSGDCSAYAENGEGEMECNGTCEGDCTGTCELAVAAECSGSCHGECKMPAAEVECEGTCEGSCSAECSGSCEGTATPPSCSAEGECEASADCQASASAEASASVECTPPSIDIAYKFNASLDAEGQAAFVAKIGEFKARMITVVQGMFKLRALIDADYAAEIGITSPVDAIAGQVDVLLEADLGSFDIPAGRIACVFPALEASFDILAEAGGSLVATVDAQFDLVGTIGM